MTARRSLVLAILALALVACAPVAVPAATAPPATPAAAPSVFTRAITSEPASLDPHGAVGSGQSAILPYILDTLVFRDLDGGYLPYLAESWEVAPDAASITFELRSDVVFHDGTPLDAAAVIYTFERFQEKGARSPFAGTFANIAAMEAPDSHTVVIRFKEPTTSFLSVISSAYAGIISPTAAEAAGDDFGANPVGSGPYQLASWQPGVSVTLTRNSDYAWAPSLYDNQGPPHIETLVFEVVPDTATQLAALQAGEVDMIFVNQPGHLALLQQDEDIVLTQVPLNGLVWLGFNCVKPPFDDVAVRQALAHAVDKDEILEAALGGIGEPAFAPLPSTLPGFDPALKEHELGYDPDRAKALLAEAGFAQGDHGAWARDGEPLRATLLTSTRPPNQAVATVLQSQLAAIGVPVEIQALEAAAAMEAAAQGQFDLLLWRYDWSDADVLAIYFSSARIGRTNRLGYSNPAVDELLAAAQRQVDADERNALYFEAQTLILADAPIQPLYTPIEVYAARSRVEGIEYGAAGRVLLNDATIAAE